MLSSNSVSQYYINSSACEQSYLTSSIHSVIPGYNRLLSRLDETGSRCDYDWDDTVAQAVAMPGCYDSGCDTLVYDGQIISTLARVLTVDAVLELCVLK